MVFLLGAFGLSWLFIVPLWLGDGIASPLLQPLAAAMMFTPTLGVLAVWLRKRAAPAELVAQTGLGLGPSKTRTFGLAAVAWLSVPAFAALTLALGVVLGLVTLDLSGLSLYRDTMGVQGANLHAAWAGQVLTGLTLGTVVTMIPAFGEEWGWRGWLVPWLSAEAGVSRGLLISGLIWGLWHAPLTLLGYNYPNLGAWAALVFVGFCVTFGLVLGLAAVAHGQHLASRRSARRIQRHRSNVPHARRRHHAAELRDRRPYRPRRLGRPRLASGRPAQAPSSVATRTDQLSLSEAKCTLLVNLSVLMNDSQPKVNRS
ncbi:hypothetical protein GCM10020220_006760 [Nonomuraea rubra]|uniref:CPBP family intramembrane glutamic endopeptidase n=1 Tax=Nonomuraea rubra TaxID=46180 RepID=UPI0031E5B11D